MIEEIGWINVKAGLPTELDLCLISVGGVTKIGFYSGLQEKWLTYKNNVFLFGEVTYWAKFPVTPEHGVGEAE